MGKKTLLLDIDNTLMDQNTPHPYLKEFLERMSEKFELGFFTAASAMRVTEICRVLFHDFNMDRDFIRKLQFNSLSRNNCPTVNHYKADGGVIEIKCMKSASEYLKVPIEDLLLLDDSPMYDSPFASQIIQAEGFNEWDVDEDDYLKRLDINDEDFKGKPLDDLNNFFDGNVGGQYFDLKTVNKNLSQWQFPTRQQPFVNAEKKLNRNDQCPCGSGKKVKKCCTNG